MVTTMNPMGPNDPNQSRIITIVYDCGGRGGVHRSWRGFAGCCRYVGFEPEEEEAGRLVRADAGQGATDAMTFESEPIALAGERGERVLHIYSQPDLSSLFRFDSLATHRYRHEDVRLIKRTVVTCEPLDEVSSRRNDCPDFLSLDAQGSELEILSGARGMLNESVIGLRCEVCFLPLYEKQPLFDSIMSTLTDHGFRCVRLEKPGSGAFGVSTDCGPFSRNVEDGALAWADAIFIKDPRILLADSVVPTLAAERVFKYVLFSITNGIGSLGLDLVYQRTIQGRLDRDMQSINAVDRRLLFDTIINYLAELNHSDADVAHFRPKNFRSMRQLLHKELHDAYQQALGKEYRHGVG